MRKILLPLFAALLLSVVCPPVRAAAADLSEARCQQLLTELAPSADELWRTVPWQIELLEAQSQAAREAKPIFIWAMDGHPLGCT